MSKQANRNGGSLEDSVADVLRRQGFAEGGRGNGGQLLPGRWFIRWPKMGQNIFGETMKGDFKVEDGSKSLPFDYIECKSQDTSGSAEQKLACTVLSIKENGKRTLLILDGAGFRKSVIAWCKRQVDGALVDVLSFSEFRSQVDRGLFD